MKKIFFIGILSLSILGAGNITYADSISEQNITVNITENSDLPILTMTDLQNTPEEFLPNEFIVNDNDILVRSGTLGHQKWTKVSTTRKLTNGFIGWHPGWSAYQYNISAYYFSSSTVGLSFSLGYGPISLSVAQKGSAGQIIKADPKKMDPICYLWKRR